jgi:hypothetical protein
MVDNVINPDDKKATEAEASRQLYDICACCPDPLAAMDIVLESTEPLTATEMVDLALACPYRDIRYVPESEIPLENPLRHMRFSVSDAK